VIPDQEMTQIGSVGLERVGAEATLHPKRVKKGIDEGPVSVCSV